jgi:hypothetical protein
LSNSFNLPAGSGTYTVVIADLDGDGKPDLILDNDYDATIWIYQNIGSSGNLSAASFAQPVVLKGASVVGGPDELLDLTVADLDGDGRLDIVVANQYNNVVSVFQNLSSPGVLTSNSFGARIDLPVGAPVSVAVADLDGDGKPDISAVSINDGTLSVLRNISTGGLLTSSSFAAAMTFALPAKGSKVVARDIDGDGKIDLVTANFGTASGVSLFDNTSTPGSISFAPRVDLATPATSEVTMAVGDIDGDGKQDLIVGSYLDANFSVYRNIGSPGSITTGSFAAPVTFGAGADVQRGGIALGDIDGDGKLDIAIVGQYSGSVYLFRNLSTPGSFTSSSLAPPVTFASGNNSVTVAIGDLDGDGRPDIAIANAFGNNLTLWKNVVPVSVSGPPVITSFTPSSGAPGTVVNIGGVNFDPTPGHNIVYFGAVQALVTQASPTKLTVTVPSGAIFAPISETVNGLTAASSVPFLPTFPGTGPLSFSSLSNSFNLNGGNGPLGLAIGDIDGDGKPDLVLANDYDATIWIYRNIGSNGNLAAASFAAPVILSAGPVGSFPDNLVQLVLADLDGDGRLDIVTENEETGMVNVFQNLSSPGSLTTSSFGPRIDLPVGSQPVSVAVGDMDGDGKPDIIAANFGSGTLSILRNLSTGGLLTSNSFAAAMSLSAPGNPSQVLAQDLDGDGKADLVVANYNTSSGISIFRNTSTPGTFSFASRVDLSTPSSAEVAIAIGDIDGDGNQDVVVGSYNTANFSVYRNIGSPGSVSVGSFAAPVTFATGPDIPRGGIALGDIDGDGKLDLAVVGQYSSSMYLYRNLSTPGSFTSSSLASPVTFASGNNPATVVIGDLDGDGRPDIVMANTFGNNLTLWQNVVPSQAITPPPSCTPPASGIAAWWRAEGNVNDSINGNNGTINGGVSYGPGEVGQAFNFDGTTGYISIPASPSLNIGVGSGITMECWINPSHLGPVGAAGRPIVEYDSPSAAATELWFENGSILYANLVDTNGGNHTISSAQNSIVTNTWQHVAVTYDKSSGNCFLYINGVQAASANFGNMTPQTTYPLYLGDRAASFLPGTGSLYNGLMDEVGLYSRALSAGEIAAIYNAGSAGKCFSGVAPMITGQPTNQTVAAGGTASFTVTASGSPTLAYQWYNGSGSMGGETNATLTLNNVTLSEGGSYYVIVSNPYGSSNSASATLTVTNPVINPPTCTGAPSGLVGWWRAEGNAFDSAGVNNGVITGAVSFATGKVGQAFQFNDTNEDIIIPASPSLDVGLSAGLTLEAWINPQNVSNYNPIFEWNPGDGNNYWGVHMYVLSGSVYNTEPVPGTLYANVQGVGDVWHQLWSAPGTVTNGGFQHVALTYDKASGIATLYCNGAMVAQQTFGSFTPKTFDNLHIGRRPIDPAGSRFTFGGLIDEASVYNRALSQSEIQSIYNAGSAGKCLVPAGPSIIGQPKDETVEVGGTASFTVTASGSPTLNYQWYNGGGSITGATNATLTLSNVQLSAAGGYYVTVSNPYGSSNSATATLTVSNPPPSCAQAPSGLTAWWKAENNTLDSINANNGVFQGTASYASGEVGQAFNFNGSSYVQVPDSPTLRFTNGMSVEAWVNLNHYTGRATEIISKLAALGLNANSYSLSIEGADTASTHRAYLIVDGPVGSPINGIQLFSSVDIPTNQWVHIAGTYDGLNAKIYVNGVLSASTTYAYGINPGTQPLSIGCSINGGPVSLFNGQIDETSLYNRALSASEIQGIYNAGSLGKCVVGVAPTITSQPTNQTVTVGGTANFTVGASGSPVLTYQWYNGSGSIPGGTNSTLTLSNVQLSAAGSYYATVSNPYGSSNSATATLTVSNPPPPSCTPEPSGLVAWWKAEGNGDDAIGGNTALLQSGVAFAPGEVGQAFLLNNSSNAYLRVPASPSLNVGAGSGLTVEAWINVADATSFRPIAEWNDGQGNVGVHLWLGYLPGQVGVLYANVVDSNGNSHTLSSPSGAVAANVFEHVALTYDQLSGVATLFVNGQIVAQSNLGSFVPRTTEDFWMGHRPGDVPGDWTYGAYLGGLLDELSIYSRALSQGEIQAVYNAGSMGKCFVGVPPMITSEPTNQTVTVGATASFIVGASGSPVLTYQWYNGSGSITGATNSTLTLSNVQLSATDSYYVTVSNPYGSTNSTSATLTVMNPPPPPSGVPVITSINPAAGLAGSEVTITGSNFAATAAGDIVYFGAVQAAVVDGNTSNLTVIAPVSATYAAISVTVNGLTGYSDQLYMPTFPGTEPLSSSTFAPLFNLNTPSGPSRSLIADLDGDGRPDLIVADNYAGTISIFQNISSNGVLSADSFGPRIDLVVGPSGGEADAYTIAAADLDGDGRLDIVAINADHNIVSIFRNISSPGTLTSNSFDTRIDLPGDSAMRGVAVQDLDGDGRPEIVTGSQTGNGISIYKNESSIGSIAFAPRVFFHSDSGATTIAIGDIDGDGVPDIAVGNYDAGTISVFRNLGFTGTINSNSFAAPVNFASPANPFGLALGDLDGDGQLDIVIGGGIYSSTLGVLRNTSTPGTVSFAPVVDFALPGWGNFVAVGDLDGDGKLDIAVVTQLGSYFSVFRNISTPGSFTTASLAPRIDLPAGYNANGVAIGDLDGDGRPDVVFGNSYDATISVYQNLASMVVASVPVITAVDPVSGVPGSTVSITGSNFSATAANNIVYFGAVQAAVTGASSSNLTVTLPIGATFGPITETVQGLTAASSSPFMPTFPGASPLNSSSLSNGFNLPAGSGTYTVVIADIDGDGKPDLILDNDYDATIWIYQNIGSNGDLSAGSFAPPVILQGASLVGTPDDLVDLTVADLDGDGRLDIVVANEFNNVVSVFQNLSSPGILTSNSFGARIDLPVGAPVSVTAADLDGDGKPDIAAVSVYDGSLSVLRNISTGGLLTSNSFAAAMNFALPGGGSKVVARDIDGDGKIDLVTANFGTTSGVSLFDNTSTPGSISFAPRVDLATPATSEVTLAVGDIDGDGKQDLIVGAYLDANFSVYRNIGSPGSIAVGSFAAPVTFAAGTDIQRGGIALGDIDGDGKPDIAIVGQYSDNVYLYRNLSTPGSFTSSSLASPVTFATGDNPVTVAIGDLNGDGRPDIAIANAFTDNLTVWQNVVPIAGANQPPVADASATASPVISPNGTNATVLLDGSLSHDPDGDPLQYEWVANGVSVGSGVTLSTVLPVGSNQVTLAVSDGIATNQQTITVQVITVAQAIQELSDLVTTDFSKAQSMAALLANAIKSVDKSNPTAAINQLKAFQNQVNAQIAPLDPALAQLLVQDAQDIIDVLSGTTKKPVNNNQSLFLRQANGHAYLGFRGAHQQSYSIEASSDLVHWSKVGPAHEVLTGSFEFEDLSSSNAPARYFRVVAP